MWFLPARNARRTPAASTRRGAFRPRLEALEDRCLLSAGALDTMNFGSGGLVTGPITQANAVVVQPNGKIVAGGYTTANGLDEFALVRYNSNGSLDTTFGNHGVVQTAVGVNNSYINGIAIDANGNIVAVGQAVNKYKGSYDPAFALARYLPMGVLDTTFGSGGIALTYVEFGQFTSGTVGAFAVAIDGSGVNAKIYVAGTASPKISSDVGAGDQFALARYTAKGVLDTTFGGTGLV